MMSDFIPPVPQSNRSGTVFKTTAATSQPAFPAPVRWTLRVLAWLAFAVASYLAWHAVTQTSVAGCSIGSSIHCDVVLTSSWSRWLGIPVAILGLACYATLAALSVLLGLRSAPANRWIATIFTMLSIVAAGASLWFIALQMLSIQSFCLYCLIVDSSGIALGVIAAASAVRSALAQRAISPSSPAHPGLAALRTAMPAGPGIRQPITTVPAQSSSPWLIASVSGAVAMICLLIGGQLLFSAKMFDVQKVALNNAIKLDNSKSQDGNSVSPSAKTHVAMLPTEATNGDRADASVHSPDSTPDATAKNTPTNDSGKNVTKSGSAGDKNAADASNEDSEPAPPTKHRLIKFLGGKLTLDTYEHPIIGSPEAPHIAIEMVSYSCPHCRKMYTTMQHALHRYGDQVALLILPEPLDSECNRLVTRLDASHQGDCMIAKLCVGIAKINPSAFATFHNFLMSTKDAPPTMDLVIPKAYVLAKRNQLRALMHGDKLTKQLDGYIDLYDQLQKQSHNPKFGLPVQILGDYIMTGSVESEADVFKAWEEHLGVKPQ
ncbi:MAG TPA: vitamin K epoxide reductase family protein [Lacipirellulaceae bacterium]|nr:vitamin K epoxide reductase family protein [Lacipirellulaceae bacterium]